MLEARQACRVGVVRIVGSLGQVGPRAVTSAFPGCLTIQAVISASTGALRLRTLPLPGGLLPAFKTRRAAAAAALRPSSTATLHVGRDKVSYLLGTGQLRSIKIAA